MKQKIEENIKRAENICGHLPSVAYSMYQDLKPPKYPGTLHNLQFIILSSEVVSILKVFEKSIEY